MIILCHTVVSLGGKGTFLMPWITGVLEWRANHDSALSWQRAEADRKKRLAAVSPFPYPWLQIYSSTETSRYHFTSDTLKNFTYSEQLKAPNLGVKANARSRPRSRLRINFMM
jgi:hypothetical protein